MPASNETSSEDGYSSVDYDLDSDTDELRPCVQSLGLSRYYQPAWSRQEAFREFYQNWKDGIIASFNLQPRDFRPVMKQTGSQIQISVFLPAPSEQLSTSQPLLGYILFKKKPGSVELTNFKAELKMEHLWLGNSTKRDQERFAGCHGEGFKIAALIMRRHEHAVRFASNSYYWNFRFRGRYKSNFACALSQAKPAMVERKKEAYNKKVSAGARRGLISNIWEDVTVLISKARGEEGQKISEEDFLSWLRVTFDINAPDTADIVRTEHGDLILDQRFCGRIYLKGLLIPGHGHDTRPYIFGYNFHRGQVNRDRERLSSAQEEAKTLANIWEKSMVAMGDSIIDRYIKLFHDSDKCLDINMIEDNISRLAVTAIWNRLRDLHPRAFFYAGNNELGIEDTSQTDIIENDLRKTPYNLPITLCRILRKHSLIRTANEERHTLFAKSEKVAICDVFSFNISRALWLSMALMPALCAIKIDFVASTSTSIDLLYIHEQKSILIHQKWINFDKSHANVRCDAFSMRDAREVNKDLFLCDHIVEDLLEMAISAVSGKIPIPQMHSRALRRAARQMLERMPRLVQVSSTTTPNQLKVTWIGNERSGISKVYAKGIQYIIILHKMSTCQAKQELRVYTSPQPTHPPSVGNTSEVRQMTSACSCGRQLSSYEEAGVTFNGLDPSERYFALVARAESGSVFGVPSRPISPIAQLSNDTRIPNTDNPILTSNSAPHNVSSRSVHADSPHLNFSGNTDESDDDSPEKDVTLLLNSVSRQQAKASSRDRVSQSDLARRSKIQSAFEEDMKAWESWHDEALHLLSQSNTAFGTHDLESSFSLNRMECPDLNYTFEVDEYAYIRLNSNAEAGLVIYIHEIRGRDTGEDQPSYYMQVRKYSFRESDLFIPDKFQVENEGSVNRNELLLHFSDFGRMGERSDAEIILLNNICHATSLWTKFGDLVRGVTHVGPLRSLSDTVMRDSGYSELLCRFAISSSSDGAASCITPLAARLLDPSQRPRRPEFNFDQEPMVFDLTANILGPAEGFAKAGFSIHFGIGNEQEQTVTWKVRYPRSHLYDGPSLGVLEEFESGRLELLQYSDPPVPRLALIAAAPSPFRLNDNNESMPSVDEFLRPAELAIAAAKSKLKPHFVVLMMHSAVLHKKVIGRFSAIVFDLLEHNYSVHLRLTMLQQHGLPQDKSILIMVAAPPSISLPWHINWPLPDTQLPCKVKDLIGDILFENPRASMETKGGFVCSIPTSDNSVPNGARLLYNHQTGRASKTENVSVDMDSSAIVLASNRAMTLLHPTRKDLLTVRELARLQGFEDGFAFYGPERSQRMEVLRAIPPIIAQRVAKIIQQSIYSMRPVRVGGYRYVQPVNKRPRLDNEPSLGE